MMTGIVFPHRSRWHKPHKLLISATAFPIKIRLMIIISCRLPMPMWIRRILARRKLRRGYITGLRCWDDGNEIIFSRRHKKEKERLTSPSSLDIKNIIELAGFEVIKQDWRIICPYSFLGLGHLFNRYIATLPGIRILCLRNYAVARSTRLLRQRPLSTTVLIPCRNERGNCLCS